MIEWFTWLQVWVAIAAGLFCLVLGLLGRQPNDYPLGAPALVEVLPIPHLVVATVAPVVGNPRVVPGAPMRRRKTTGGESS